MIAALALSWIAIAALALGMLALARQIGVLHERVAPMGALTMDSGPKTGQAAPPFTLSDIATGRAVRIGPPGERALLVFFVSTTCPVCKKLLPILRSIAADERRLIDVILASDGERDEHLAFYRREKLAPFPYVLSPELGLTYHISRLPTALLIGPDGRIAAKGLVNNREQIESLLTAHEMGVGSLQDFLSASHALEAKHETI